MVEDGAMGLLPVYMERLHTEEATLDDQRKGLDLMFKAMGIGASEKADTRVIVDIVFENGMVTTKSAPVIEMQHSELLEHVGDTLDIQPPDAPVQSQEPEGADLPDMDAMMADLENDLEPVRV